MKGYEGIVFLVPKEKILGMKSLASHSNGDILNIQPTENGYKIEAVFPSYMGELTMEKALNNGYALYAYKINDKLDYVV